MTRRARRNTFIRDPMSWINPKKISDIWLVSCAGCYRHSDQLRRLNARKAVKRPLIAIAAALICLWLGLWLVQHVGVI